LLEHEADTRANRKDITYDNRTDRHLFASASRLTDETTAPEQQKKRIQGGHFPAAIEQNNARTCRNVCFPFVLNPKFPVRLASPEGPARQLERLFCAFPSSLARSLCIPPLPIPKRSASIRSTKKTGHRIKYLKVDALA
jgi:hypothetical protein